MNSIASEPARLHAEQHRVKRELAVAAVGNYPVLVEAAERSNTIAAACDRGSRLAGSGTEALTKLREESSSLQTAGGHWRIQKQKVGAATANAGKLAELLDAPQTLEACLRGELYHEARVLIERLSSLHEALPASPTVSKIVAQAQQVLDTLIDEVVVPRLSGNLTVPTALKITSFLRHMGAAEGSLRDAFLGMRAQYITSFIAEEELIDSTLPATILKRVLVHWKFVVAEAIAIYNGCFSDTDENRQAVSRWALDRSDQLLGLWNKHLLSITSGAELADIAQELCHCSGPWSSVGLDLTPLLLEAVVGRVGDVFEATVAAGASSFSVALNNPSWKQSAMSPKSAGPVGGASDGSPIAPSRLVQCLPLTYVAHSIVTACNDIRRCAALAAKPRCFDVTKALMAQVLDEVSAVRDDPGASAQDREQTEALVSIAVEDCLPFVCRCVDFVFDVSDLHDRALPQLLESSFGS